MPLYTLLEYSSNYSEIMIGSLLFYSEDEPTKLNNNIPNTNNFTSFIYRAKLLGGTESDGANGLLRNSTIAVPLKYWNNFWKSLKMLLINCKLQSKFKWTRDFVSAGSGAESEDANFDNIFFTVKDTNLSLSSLYQLETIKNCQNLLANDLKDQCIGTNIKQKLSVQNMANEYRYSLEANL